MRTARPDRTMTGGCARRPCLLVLASTYPRWAGDTEPGFVHELSRRLVDRFRVIVLCPHAAGARYRELLDGVEVIRYRYAPQSFETLVNDGGIVNNLKRAPWKWLLVPGFVLMQAWQAWRLVRGQEVNVVHAHWLIPQGVVASLLHILPGGKVPFVVTAHGSDVNVIRGGFLTPLKRWVLRSADIVTTVGESLRSALAGIGRPDMDIRVQPMGVDLITTFVPNEVPPEGQEILFVGRLVPGKRADRLIRAMPRVLERLPGARLSVVGHGPELPTLKALAARLEVAGKVSFVGPVAHSQLPDYYRRAGVFVASFDENEGFGLVLVEAIGCACPVVASDVSAARAILGPWSSDSVVDCEDPSALADRIVAVLEEPVAARSYASQLRARAVANFDWHAVANGYANVLREAAAAAAG